MLEQVDVYYEGWGERWLWGTLVSTTAITGRPQIMFEYSNEAKSRGLELSSYTLPLEGPKLRRGFASHQLGLPGPVYDSLPDGWGMLLMDRLFKRRGLNTARIGPLERLAYIGTSHGSNVVRARGARGAGAASAYSLELLAAEIKEVLMVRVENSADVTAGGGLASRRQAKGIGLSRFSNWSFYHRCQAGFEAWLIKFPAKQTSRGMCYRNGLCRVLAHVRHSDPGDSALQSAQWAGSLRE
ncbi:HipA N-terminal domain-containing protein [Pseudomonas sp. ERMR1:02]|uniref:HipA N-terminal domain-containing protein n=1 Tax=unclassified Pseudomonas TaxID=196821 RepID=UPI0026D6FA88